MKSYLAKVKIFRIKYVLEKSRRKAPALGYLQQHKLSGYAYARHLLFPCGETSRVLLCLEPHRLR